MRVVRHIHCLICGYLDSVGVVKKARLWLRCQPRSNILGLKCVAYLWEWFLRITELDCGFCKQVLRTRNSVFTKISRVPKQVLVDWSRPILRKLICTTWSPWQPFLVCLRRPPLSATSALGEWIKHYSNCMCMQTYQRGVATYIFSYTLQTSRATGSIYSLQACMSTWMNCFKPPTIVLNLAVSLDDNYWPSKTCTPLLVASRQQYTIGVQTQGILLW